MIQASNISLRFGKKALFEEVNIKFTETATVSSVPTVPESLLF